ncbi:MAG: methionyl-tRNA formyltransferase [Clostridiales bacterium]|nr:methionyl-tRNA formyltransferase [Clostridiales bacterium]MDO4350564.1 methionyl-tRNA formyltransferase [Eubacteriales bacterium]MDY4007241.1 methionyl-tRNA formyltransferase [Candidatus Limiplasma sp.]
MRVVFMGTPDFSVPSLQALLDAGHEVAGVFTQPDRPKGRGGKVQMSPVKELALKRGIAVYQPVKIRLDGLEPLRQLAPDVCVTAAFGQILSEEVLAVPRLGTVNVHASLLPRHRGAAPIQWAILSGDAETGVTTMLTDKGLDTGDMLLKAKTPIGSGDTAGTLTERLSHIGAELLVETLNRLEAGDCPREKQDESQSTYEPKVNKELGRLCFEEGTQKCLLRVRAMCPWPCAFAELAQGVLKVWSAAPAQGRPGAPAGEVLSAGRRDGLVIATADGAIELCEVQAPNAKRMDARAFLLGHPIPEGAMLNEVRL